MKTELAVTLSVYYNGVEPDRELDLALEAVLKSFGYGRLCSGHDSKTKTRDLLFERIIEEDV